MRDLGTKIFSDSFGSNGPDDITLQKAMQLLTKDKNAKKQLFHLLKIALMYQEICKSLDDPFENSFGWSAVTPSKPIHVYLGADNVIEVTNARKMLIIDDISIYVTSRNVKGN